MAFSLTGTASLTGTRSSLSRLSSHFVLYTRVGLNPYLHKMVFFLLFLFFNPYCLFVRFVSGRNEKEENKTEKHFKRAKKK